ncbi:MAG: HD-GYP domain-containing protein [Atopobiaceae bacterium]|nr:HD-GYP domain-containing protein [Atopobiaceae bacterium]
MDFIRAHQLDMMLFLSGSCGILAVMTLMPRFLSVKRRSILLMMELASMMQLIFDRLSYEFRGNESLFGGFMVRISNAMTYFLILLILLLVSYFIKDLCMNEGGLKELPKRLRVCDVLFVIGTMLIIVTQFTGLYYTFDAHNNYQRAAGNVFSYVLPFLMVIIQESVLIRYGSKLNRKLVYALAISIILPTFAAIIQFFNYGVSLISMTLVLVVNVFFVYTLTALGAEVGQARTREIEFYKEAQKREATLFEETVEALANAIDAKDKYTHGHSTRVAILSKLIAEEAGLSEKECEEVYFAALLHDVGKIGVPDEVINKPSGLTDEEFEQIKQHPVTGNQILLSIRQSPYLSIGAHYHHERYDGSGYPEGLSGEDIPRIARIIAVADAYDAMTSTRSYRGALARKKVRDEIANGMGRQFDYDYAAIMLRLIDTGVADEVTKS